VVGDCRENMAYNKPRAEIVRSWIDRPLPYTKAETIAEVASLLDKISWGQEVEVRLAPDRDRDGKPVTTLSAKSQEKAQFTVARVSLSTRRPRIERPAQEAIPEKVAQIETST